jgi:hypothetical protein
VSDLDADAPGTEGRRTTSRWSLLVLRWRRFRGRLNWGPLLLVALAVLVGLLFGRTTAPDPTALAAREIDARLLPLALDADGIWTSAGDAREPVSEAFVQFRREGDPSLVEEHHEDWQAAYDAVLVQLAGLPLSPSARPVQRQFIAAIALSRDAIDVLAHAAIVEDEALRQDLLTEVGRLRQRSEQLTQSARASMLDLEGQRADVSPLGPLTSFMEGRR